MKKYLFSGVLAVIIVAAGIWNVKDSDPNKLSRLSLANIEALANGESDVAGPKTPSYSWTSNEETHMEGKCIVTTYDSHIGCLNINNESCSPGVSRIRHRDCP